MLRPRSPIPYFLTPNIPFLSLFLPSPAAFFSALFFLRFFLSSFPLSFPLSSARLSPFAGPARPHLALNSAFEGGPQKTQGQRESVAPFAVSTHRQFYVLLGT
jgi:hypothetical protein